MSLIFRGTTLTGGLHKTINDTGMDQDVEIISYPPGNGTELIRKGTRNRTVVVEAKMIQTSLASLVSQENTWMGYKKDKSSGTLKTNFISNGINNVVLMDMQLQGRTQIGSGFISVWALTFTQLAE